MRVNSMSDPQTLLLREDDDRTVVDRRPDGGPLTHEVIRFLPERIAFFRRWRVVLCATVAAALCCGLSGWVYHERGVGEELRERIEELERSRPSSFVRSVTHGSAGRVVPHFAFGTDPREVGTGPVDRGNLEHRGARLLGTNNYRAALPYYQALSARYPEDRVFSDVVAVLHAKLRCESLQGRASSQCD